MDHFSTIVYLANLTKVPLLDGTTSQGTELCTEGTTLVPLLERKGSRMEQNGRVPSICEKKQCGDEYPQRRISLHCLIKM